MPLLVGELLVQDFRHLCKNVKKNASRRVDVLLIIRFLNVISIPGKVPHLGTFICVYSIV